LAKEFKNVFLTKKEESIGPSGTQKKKAGYGPCLHGWIWEEDDPEKRRNPQRFISLGQEEGHYQPFLGESEVKCVGVTEGGGVS